MVTKIVKKDPLSPGGALKGEPNKSFEETDSTPWNKGEETDPTPRNSKGEETGANEDSVKEEESNPDEDFKVNSTFHHVTHIILGYLKNHPTLKSLALSRITTVSDRSSLEDNVIDQLSYADPRWFTLQLSPFN